MSTSQSSPLTPTYIGYIQNTWDALIVFECCLNGLLAHIPRRPHDKERAELIKSGYVFVYEEHSSGIKRWTDGVNWSPSRIMNNFLVYRELNRPFPPGEKKKALKRNQRKSPEVGSGLGSGGITKKSPSHVDVKPQPTTPPALSASNYLPIGSAAAAADHNGMTNMADKDLERALVGSLIDSYDFREEGRVKKTISITFQGVQHHLVSYYTIEDVKSGKLVQPSKDPRLSGVWPRPELLMAQNFRMSLEELDYPEPAMAYVTSSYAANTNGAPSNGGAQSTLYRAVRNHRDHPLTVPASLNGSYYALQEPSRSDRPGSFMYAPPGTLSEQANTHSSGRYAIDFTQQPSAFSYSQQSHAADYPHPTSSTYQPHQPFSSMSTTLGQDYPVPSTSGPESHGSFSMDEGPSYLSSIAGEDSWNPKWNQIGGGH
jgi:Gti1/Pac2 family transcription factor